VFVSVLTPLVSQDGLKYVAAWNMGMLQTEDLKESFAAIMQKRKPVYSKL
jgi:hypothetical protein